MSVSGNDVTINGGTISGDNVSGGYGEETAVISGNTVIINGGKIETDVYGGQGVESADVIGNALVLNGGEIDSGSDLVGGYAKDGKVSGNSLLVNTDSLSQDDPRFIAGGRGNAEVSENSVILQAGTVSQVYGGHSVNGDAAGNRVVVTGGRVTGELQGGYAAGAGAASGNIVEISDGTFEGSIYGGLSDGGAANGNQVVISGGTILSG